MALSKCGNGRRGNCIVIRNPKLIEVNKENCERILKLNDNKFVINEKQMIEASNYFKRLLIDEKKKKKVILLDSLKEKQPCFDATGLAIAVSFATGYAEIPLNQIICALAAANALEMWNMRMTIIEQLWKLAAEPESASFAINVAVCNLEKHIAKYIVKQSLNKFDEIIKQSSFLFINDKCFEFFISSFIHKKSATMDKYAKQFASESVVRAIRVWCGNDDQRHTFAKNMLSKLRPSCEFDIIDQIEKAIGKNPAIHSLRDKIHLAKETAAQNDAIRMTRAIDDPITDSDQLLKFETFRQIELPATEPDVNGIHHYSFVIEFEAPKDLLPSDKPKHIGLQLEAILECPN